MADTPAQPPAPFPFEPVSPDLLEYARQTFDLEDFLQDVREIRATGGVPFETVIAEVEAEVRRK